MGGTRSRSPIVARLRSYVLGLCEPLLGPAGLAELGAALVDCGQSERALLLLHERLHDHPDEAPMHYEAGRAAQSKGLSDQARARFAMATTLVPDEPAYHFALGYALHEEKRLAAAATEYRAVLDLMADEPRALFNLAVVERDLGRRDASSALLERLVHVRPKDARAWYTKGLVHYEQRELGPARFAFEMALRREPRHARSLYQMGAVLLAEGQSVAAEPFLRRALAERPGFAAAHYALGRTLADRDPGRALHHLREAVLGAEPVRVAHLEMARLHERAGRLGDAAAELRVYLRHNPEEGPESSARRHLRRILSDRRRVDQAPD